MRTKRIITTKTISISPAKMEIMLNAIKEENEVIIIGLGTFKIKTIRSRKFLHNRGNKIITTPTKNKLHFTPTLSIKQYIQQCKTTLK